MNSKVVYPKNSIFHYTKASITNHLCMSVRKFKTQEEKNMLHSMITEYDPRAIEKFKTMSRVSKIFYY
jgi:hypothetical protein